MLCSNVQASTVNYIGVQMIKKTSILLTDVRRLLATMASDENGLTENAIIVLVSKKKRFIVASNRHFRFDILFSFCSQIVPRILEPS